MKPLTDQEHMMILQRTSTIEGNKPDAAPIPPPGIYWLRTMQARHAYWIDRTGARLDHPQHNEIWGVYAWNTEEGPWFLADVSADGSWEIFASDEGRWWETSMEVVTSVGPRVDPPKEER
ncbi:MAG: hypothetical protein NUV51_09540 [Sulfuricaulis sp.]|nr:hypothetical protein [Sulfuricaulis sp.]